MEENDEHTNGRTSAGGRQSILLNLKLSFETQSFKPKRKKVIRAVETAGKGP